MARLHIRDVPVELKTWLDEQVHQERSTQNEFLLSLLSEARRDLSEARRDDSQLELFEAVDIEVARSHHPHGLPFSFIDLFSGIGGFRLGLEAVGGRCVFSCEKDKFAQKTYKDWFGELPVDDITEIDPASIPDHDVLSAGFPCQPFSIAGVSKKNSLGRAHGFKDEIQGTLFFHLATVIEVKRPPVFVLENVKNLRSHDRGKTWQVIQSTLDGLGYHLHADVIDAAGWVPQHRERIFVVGFDREIFGDQGPGFSFPQEPDGPRPKFSDILDPDTPAKYTLTDHLWEYLQKYAAKHRAKGNGFGFGMTDLDGVSRTLSARYHKDGSEVLIPQGPEENPRRLSPREAARLMGFPDDKPIVVSDTQAYRQFGNAVVPLVVEAIGLEINRIIAEHILGRFNGCLLKTTQAQGTAA
jgi:DNA (cytosine-5)-methyltransferase 1